VAQGSLGVFTAPDGSPGETKLSTLSVGDAFGEMALMTNEPRSATVRAEGRATVLRLGQQPFVDLLRRESAVGYAVASILSRRLREADRARLQGDFAISQSVDRALDSLPADRRLRLLQAGLLSEVSPEALKALFGERGEEVGQDLQRIGGDRGAPPPAALRALRDRLERERAEEERQRFITDSCARLCDAGCWESALGLLTRQPEREAFLGALSRALQAVPPLPESKAAPWVSRVTDEEAAEDPVLALAAAALYRDQGDPSRAVGLLQHALGVALLAGDAAVGQQLSEEIARLSGSAASHARIPDWRAWARTEEAFRVAPRAARLRAVAGIAAGVAFVGLAVAVGGGQRQTAFLLLLGAAFALWNSDLFPDSAVTLALAASWIIWGIADSSQAMAGFASMDWVFVLAVLGVAVAVARSGLLYRVGLLLVKRTPESLLWQSVTLLVTGVLLSPLLPDPRGRAALTGPLALAVAQACRLRDREPGAAMLGLAAWVGSGPLMFLFLNASAVCLLGWGLLPDYSRVRVDWVSWLLAAFPLGIFVGLGTIAALLLVFRPTIESAPSRERLNLQLAVLGPLSPREAAMLIVLLLMVGGWVVAAAAGVHVGVVAVLGLFAAVAAGCFDQRSFREMDWNYLIYYGGALSIASLSNSLGVSRMAAESLGGRFDLLGGGSLLPASPVIFVLLAAIVSLAVRTFLEPTQAMLLLGLTFIPAASVVGVDPWVVVMALLATNSPWFLEKQTPGYRVAYAATDGRLYSHRQARNFAFAYAGVTLVGLVLAMPFWHLFGLL
jgi:di/tricarboxylate transporter